MPRIKHEGENKSTWVCWLCSRQLGFWKWRAGSRCGWALFAPVREVSTHSHNPGCRRSTDAVLPSWLKQLRPGRGQETHALSESAMLFLERLFSCRHFEKLTKRKVSYLMKYAFLTSPVSRDTLILFFTLKEDLPLQPKLASNSPCSSGCL